MPWSCHLHAGSTQSAQIFARTVKVVWDLSNMLSIKKETGKNQHPLDEDALNYITRNPSTDKFQPTRIRTGTANHLVPDFPTQRSFPYHMFQRLLWLCKACNKFYKGWNYKTIALFSVKWKHVEQMCHFLKPLIQANVPLLGTSYSSNQHPCKMRNTKKCTR